MKISELQPKTGNVDIELEVIEKQEPREFSKFGKSGRVCNCVGKDETGTVKITLWNEQIDEVNQGDVVKFENGYVNEFQGDMQVTTGKFGQMSVLKKSEE